MAQVLVVDDSSTVRNEVCDFLKQNGLTVVGAVDGKDGLDKLRTDPAIKLVVSDVNMPNMDGLTMAEKIRSELRNLSFVMAWCISLNKLCAAAIIRASKLKVFLPQLRMCHC